MKRIATSGVLLAVALSAILAIGGAVGSGFPAAAATHPAAPSFEAGTCPPELAGHPRITCGTLVVHDPAHSRGWADTRLAVATVHASSATPRPDPIVYIHGGPGGEIVRAAADAFENSGLATDRDVILLDQRGGGLSEPLLTCPEVEQLDWTATLKVPENDPATLEATRQARRECQQRLIKAGTDPAAVSTASIAGDVAALRRALGIKAWNVLGFSYGGRVALQLLEDHPEGVRSVLLDAPLPTDKSVFDPARIGSALEELFHSCAASPGCAGRHPDLRGEWTTQLHELETTPATVAVPTTADHPAADVAVDGARFVNAAIRALFDPGTIPSLPDLIVDPGTRAIIADLAATNVTPSGPLAAYTAVVCSEDATIRVPTTNSKVVGDFPTNASFGHDCDGWQAKPAPAASRAVPRTKVPVLITHGQFDPAIPNAWVTQLATRMHSRLVKFPGLSHGVVNGDNVCGIAVANAYFDEPGQRPDTSCIQPSSLP